MLVIPQTGDYLHNIIIIRIASSTTTTKINRLKRAHIFLLCLKDCLYSRKNNGRLKTWKLKRERPNTSEKYQNLMKSNNCISSTRDRMQAYVKGSSAKLIDVSVQICATKCQTIQTIGPWGSYITHLS